MTLKIEFPNAETTEITVPGDSTARKVVRTLLKDFFKVKDLSQEDVRDMEMCLIYVFKTGSAIMNQDDLVAEAGDVTGGGPGGTWQLRRGLYLRDFRKPTYEGSQLCLLDQFIYNQFVADYYNGQLRFKLKDTFIAAAYIMAQKHGRFEAATHDPLIHNPLTLLPEWFKLCMEWVYGNMKKTYGHALTNLPQFEMLNKTNC